MAIIESSATALVRFTGLGIIIFNKEKQRGEVAIIRDEKHQLSIKIQQPRFKDGIDKDIIVYEDIASYANLPKKDVEIGESSRKFGRTTGFTGGNIFSIYLDIWIKYDRTGQESFFKHQFLVEPDQTNYEKFVDKGDSGSLVVDGENFATGLIFAGANRTINAETCRTGGIHTLVLPEIDATRGADLYSFFQYNIYNATAVGCFEFGGWGTQYFNFTDASCG